MYSILEKDEVKMPPCSRVHVPLGDGSDPKFDQMVASEVHPTLKTVIVIAVVSVAPLAPTLLCHNECV